MCNRKILLDLDGTLTIEDKSKDYSQKSPNPRVLSAAKRALRDFDGEISIYTARGMRSNEGDLSAIERYISPVIAKWLEDNSLGGLPVIIGKAWPGPKGFYVDDRAMTPEEFVFRFDGPMSAHKVDVVFQTTHDLSIPDLNRYIDRIERFIAIGSLTVLGIHLKELPDMKGVGSLNINPESNLRSFDYSLLRNPFVLMVDLDQEMNPELIFQLVMSLGQSTGLLGEGVGLFRSGTLSSVLRPRTRSDMFSHDELRWTINLRETKEL